MFYLNKKIINNTSKNLFSLKEIILSLIIKNTFIRKSHPFSTGNNILLSIIFFYFFV